MGFSNDTPRKLGPYPWHLAYSGEIDATGRKRPAAYYREIVWKTGIDPVSAFVAPPKGTDDLPARLMWPGPRDNPGWSQEDVYQSWSWAGHEGEPLDVVVYSEFPEVDLLLNGRSLGRKATGVETEYKAQYKVGYAPGRLVAVGYRDGREAGRWELRTAGAPAAARIAFDRPAVKADGEDLAYLTIELVDDSGVPIYATASDRMVRVRVSGHGALAGIGNGDPHDGSSFQTAGRRTFHGRAVAVLRASEAAGPITVEVDIEGLPTRRLTLNALSG